jgi:predicted MFS family arabinose efflux permease
VVRHFLSDTFNTAQGFTRNARLFLVSTFLSWTGFWVNLVLFNLYLTEGGYNEEFAGQCASLTALGMGLAALPASFLTERLGRRNSLLLGAAGLGLAMFVRAMTLDPMIILASSFAAGACHAVMAITASPFMTENSKSAVRTQLFSAHFVASLAAGFIGNLGGGQLPWILQQIIPGLSDSLMLAYRWSLGIAAFSTGLALWPLLFIRERPRVEPEAGERSGWEESAGPMAKLGLNFVLIGLGAGLIMPFFNLYFANRFGCTSAQIGLFFAASQIITLVATVAGPRLARRFGLLRTVAGLQLASLPFLVTLGFENTLWIAVAAFLARASLMQTSSPLENAFAMEVVSPRLRAITAGVNHSCWFLGWAVSANVSGWIMANVGYEYPYYMTAFFYGLASILFYWMFRKDPRGKPAPTGIADQRMRTSRASAVSPPDDRVAK